MNSTRSILALVAALGCMALGCMANEPHPLTKEKLAGDRTAAQIRDMIINALQASNVFVVTENPERADAILRGSAEDEIFTDTFQTSEGVNARASLSGGTGTTRVNTSRRAAASVGVGLDESEKIVERKHEAMAAVRLVDADGDVIWSTTQESLGAKFKGASADVADKVVKQLLADIEKARRSTINAAN